MKRDVPQNAQPQGRPPRSPVQQARNFNRLGLKKLIGTCYYSSPIAGQQLQYSCDANGQLTFYFEDKGVAENKSKRPYKAVVTQVYDKRATAVWTCWMWKNCSAQFTKIFI